MSVTEAQKQETEEEQPKEEDATERLRPSGEHRPQVIGVGDIQVTYVQKPLSFFGQMSLAKVLGRALNEAMSGGGGMALASLFGTTPEELEAATKGEGTGAINFAQLTETAMMIQAVGVLMEYTPDILVDIYVIALNVPVGQQEWARKTMQDPEDEGGLGPKDGFAILETFIAQNGEALRDFFQEHMMPLLGRFMGNASPQPAPSRATRRTTQKRSKSSSSGRGKGSK